MAAYRARRREMALLTDQPWTRRCRVLGGNGAAEVMHGECTCNPQQEKGNDEEDTEKSTREAKGKGIERQCRFVIPARRTVLPGIDKGKQSAMSVSTFRFNTAATEFVLSSASSASASRVHFVS